MGMVLMIDYLEMGNIGPFLVMRVPDNQKFLGKTLLDNRRQTISPKVTLTLILSDSLLTNLGVPASITITWLSLVDRYPWCIGPPNYNFLNKTCSHSSTDCGTERFQFGEYSKD
jgi:hypothetical protein